MALQCRIIEYEYNIKSKKPHKYKVCQLKKNQCVILTNNQFLFKNTSIKKSFDIVKMSISRIFSIKCIIEKQSIFLLKMQRKITLWA